MKKAGTPSQMRQARAMRRQVVVTKRLSALRTEPGLTENNLPTRHI